MEQRRLQLILDPDTDAILKTIRSERDMTYTATIKRAVKMLDVLLEAKDSGCSIHIVDARGKLVKELPIK